MLNKHIAILLDPKSRKNIKTQLTELSNAGIIFLKEIEDAAFLTNPRDTTVILLGNVLDNTGTLHKLKVYKNILGIKYVYMGQSSEAVTLLQDFTEVYVCDYTVIDMKMVTAVMLNDKAFQKKLRDDLLMDDKLNALLKDNNTIQEVREVLEEYQTLREKYRELKKMYDDSEKTIAQLNRRLEIVTNIKERFSEGYRQIIKSAYNLNETLKEYEGVLTADIYTKVNVHKYPNRPFIVYFKVFEELQNQDLFFEVLYEVIQKQLHKSVKIINLYDSRTCRQMKTLPEIYKRIYTSFSVNDTLPGLLAKTGDYSDLMDILLTNKTGVDFLIIVDCKAVDDTIMTGQDLSFNICSNKKHLEAHNLSDKNTVVSDKTNTSVLTFNDVDDLIKDLSKEDTFLKLSALDVFQQIVSSIKMQRSV